MTLFFILAALVYVSFGALGIVGLCRAAARGDRMPKPANGAESKSHHSDRAPELEPLANANNLL